MGNGGGEKEEEVNLQIIWPTRLLSNPVTRPVLRQVALSWSGKPLALSSFPASSLFIQTLISQLRHTMLPLHCCRTALLLWLRSNKRNLVEVQLEKSKLAVGHFDNLHRAEPPAATCPLWTSNNIHRAFVPSLGNSQHPKS